MAIATATATATATVTATMAESSTNQNDHNMHEQQQSQRSSSPLLVCPDIFQSIMFWSLFPATFVMPLWLVFGHGGLGGTAGWFALLLMYVAALPLLIYHVILAYLYWDKLNNQQQEQDQLQRPLSPDDEPLDHQQQSQSSQRLLLPLRTSYALLAYYIASFFLQFFMDDGGDQGNTGSPAERVYDVPQELCQSFEFISFVVVASQLILLLVYACSSTLDQPGQSSAQQQDDSTTDADLRVPLLDSSLEQQHAQQNDEETPEAPM